MTHIKVLCLECEQIRTMKASSWKKKDGDAPYTKTCRSCAYKQRKISEEHKEKIRKKLLGRSLSEETKEKIRNYRLTRPDLTKKLVPGAGSGWNKGLSLPERSEETKKKISESMQKENK